MKTSEEVIDSLTAEILRYKDINIEQAMIIKQLKYELSVIRSSHNLLQEALNDDYR